PSPPSFGEPATERQAMLAGEDEAMSVDDVGGPDLERPRSLLGIGMTAVRLAVAGIFIVTALAGALAVEAQQARLYRVGVLTQEVPMFVSSVAGLKDGLRELGLEEGKQVVFHVRDVKADFNSIEAAAKRLEDEKVDLICTIATSTTLATKR